MNEKLKRPAGILVLQWNDEPVVAYRNLVVDVGLRKLASSALVLTQFGAGSGTTQPDYTDVELEDEIGKITGQSGGYPTLVGDILQNAFLVDTDELNGTWHEVGLFYEDDTLFARVLVTEREKSSADQVAVWYYVDLVN